jgi:hypothetical protein
MTHDYLMTLCAAAAISACSSSAQDPVGTVSQAISSSLCAGQALNSGQALQSSNGQYRLSMESNGQAVLRDFKAALLWYAPLGGIPSSSMIMEPDGELIIQAPNGHITFRSFTNVPLSCLTVENSGKMVITDPGGTILWIS